MSPRKIKLNSLTDGLVAFFPFNGNANDESGNKHDGQVKNVLLTTDRFGTPNSAYSFNGQSSYIIVSNAEDLSFSSSFSVSFWIKASENKRESWTTVIDKSHQFGNNPQNYDWVIEQDISEPNTLKLTCGLKLSDTSGTYIYSKTSHYEINKWIHYVFIKNDSIETTYIDGQWRNIEYQQYWEINKNPSSPLIIGANNHPDKIDRYFNGIIDDIYIFDRSLSIDEVSILYNKNPTDSPTAHPTLHPTLSPSEFPTTISSIKPTELPSLSPTISSTNSPTDLPSASPTKIPTLFPTWQFTYMPIDQKEIVESKISSRSYSINDHPSACIVSDDFILSVWQSQDHSKFKIYGRILGFNDVKENIFQVDSRITNYDQTNPVSVKVSNTSCLIAWINNKADILGVVVNLIDNKIGNQFSIKNDIQTCESGPISLSAIDFNNEGYVLSWSEGKTINSKQYCSTITELFYNNGTRILLTNDLNSLSDFYNPHVASFGEIIVVTDIESRHISSSSNVHARIYNGNLGPISSSYIDIFDISKEGIPSSYNQRFLGISTVFENIITFIWENKNAIGTWQLYKKEYSISGSLVSLEFQLTTDYDKYNNINPSAISFKNGANILTCFTWHQYDNRDDASTGIYLQCLDVQNNALFKQPLEINHQYTVDSFSVNNYDHPYIISYEKKNFIVFFSELTSSNNHLDIYLQMFDKDGFKVTYPEGVFMEASSANNSDQPDSYDSIIVCSTLLMSGLALAGTVYAAYQYYYHGSKGGKYGPLANDYSDNF